MITSLVQKLQKHIRHIASGLFFFGFAVDMFLLPDVNDVLSRYIGLIYILSLAVIIIVREIVTLDASSGKAKQTFYSMLTFAIAYFSGSALSFVFVYAWRSAALSVSWPIFVILFLCMLANELISSRKLRSIVDISVLIIASLFYILFNVPFLIGKQNDWVFFLGLVLALTLSFFYIKMFNRLTKRDQQLENYLLAILIPTLVGGLYILNLMPAVPLSIKSENVYHYVQRSGANYLVLDEAASSSIFDIFRTPVKNITTTDKTLYFFAAVRAPAALTAPITHVWEYYNQNTKEWEIRNKLTFNIYGGRQDGYRAYSNITNAEPGKWRVTVKVDSGRIVGRYKFNVSQAPTLNLVEKKI